MPEQDDEDLLLERLEEATSGESSMRQLRRRYDLLRRDYEVLLDRLSELEERMAATPQPAPTAEPARAPAGFGLVEALMAPLARLREEYAAAASAMQEIVGGLDTLTRSGMKGQRGSAQAQAEPPTFRELGESERVSNGEQVSVAVDVQGSGFGDLLDFQEQLSSLPGVARVSIRAIDSEQASFVVELEK